VENSGEMFGRGSVLAGAATWTCCAWRLLSDERVVSAVVGDKVPLPLGGEVFSGQHFNIIANLSFRQWIRIAEIRIAVVINSSGIDQ
jgi:hypothetical protein